MDNFKKVVLSDALKNVKINQGLVHEAVVAYMATWRSGSANTKTRAEVSGGGKKPWQQKGTGRARSGSSRSPVWRHGGVTFGPKPRDFSKYLPKTMKRLAIAGVLRSKSEELYIIDEKLLSISKTKDLSKLMNSEGVALFVISRDKPVVRALKNIKNVQTVSLDELNTYDLVSADRVYFEDVLWKKLEERLVAHV
jgi:large subunit ribosomal protein L4